MKHPNSRLQRRNARKKIICKRRKQLVNEYSSSYNQGLYGEPPHEGEGISYLQYLDYLDWINRSEEERKLDEIFAALSGKEVKKPWYKPTEWSVYAKKHSCGSYYNRSKVKILDRRRERRKLNKLVQEGLGTHFESLFDKFIQSLVGYLKLEQVINSLDGYTEQVDSINGLIGALDEYSWVL